MMTLAQTSTNRLYKYEVKKEIRKNYIREICRFASEPILMSNCNHPKDYICMQIAAKHREKKPSTSA